jgi:uncharacterized protein
MALAPDLALDPAYVGDFCRRNGIARLSVFGSRLRNAAGTDSDLDLLVEFLPGRRVSLFDVGGMISELSERIGIQVDLRTPEDLSPMFRDQVILEAKTIYAAG